MDCTTHSGSSKQRRDMLKNETDLLGKVLPFNYGKASQLRILKAACNYLKKEKHFSNLRLVYDQSSYIDSLINYDETLRNESLSGFIVCFNKHGGLIYVSDTSYEHLGLRSLDILFTYDNIHEMVHEQDKHYFKHLEVNFDEYKEGKQFSFYSLWFVSKIKRNERSLTEYKLIKVTGHYDTKTDLYIARCTQILSVSNREILTGISADCFTSVHDSRLEFQEISTDAENLLGYNLDEDDFEHKTLYELLAVESLTLIKERHVQILNEKNTKGYLDPVKILHKNGYYVDCLMNLYCDLKDQIICKYQVIDVQSMKDYKQYVLNFKRDWDLYKLQENPASKTLVTSGNTSDSECLSIKAENDFSNFISIEESSACSDTKPLAYKRTWDVRDFDELDSLEESYYFKSKRSKVADFEDKSYEFHTTEHNQNFSYIKEEEVFDVSENKSIYDQSQNRSSMTYSEDEISYFQGDELSCFDLNEIIEINNIKEDIEKEISNFKSRSSDKLDFPFTYCKQELFNPLGNVNDSPRLFYDQNEDEQLYQWIGDNDLFPQSLQAF